MGFALCCFSFFCTCRITCGTVIRLSTYCKVHSQIQLVSCCESFPSHLKERFLHFNNRIISLLEQIVWTNLYIFYILSYSYIKLHLIPPLTYPFYPPYVSTLSPQSLWITAEKVDKSVKKRFSHQEVGKSSEKRGFYISLPKKMFTLHYAILCTIIKLSGSSTHYAVYMLYTA